MGFGWIDRSGSVPRTSHALAVDGRVYVIDPVESEGVEQRIRGLGDPAAVLVLLDRHRRDADAFAARLGVPAHETPFDGLPGTPFEIRRVVRRRVWREVALWWPEGRVLVGHGEGVHGHGASAALDAALAMSRRRIPRLAADGVRRLVRR